MLLHSSILRFILILFISIPSVIWAQNTVIRGTVVDSKTGQPVLFANVHIHGTSLGAITDENGFFAITKLKAGTYKLVVTFVGYDSTSQSVQIKENEIVFRKIMLSQASIQLEGATINAERQNAISDPNISVVKVSTKTMNRIPTIGGQADLAQYMQVIPGVVFTGDQGGQLYIRGGTPVQNMVLLDGMTIYNPFHSIGFFSVFDVDMISNVDVYTGGFGAEYGGRISSVMNISTRYGNPLRSSGRVDINTFGAKLLLEGPIVKAKTPNSGSVTYMLSVKKSYIDKVAPTLYKYVNEGNGLPFTFTDLYGKISLNGNNGSRADFFGFNFNDDVQYQTISNYNWKSYGGGMKFTLIPSQSPMMLSSNISYTNYKINFDDGTSLPRFSEVGGFDMGLDFTYFMGRNQLDYGVDIKGFKTDFSYTNSLNRTISQIENTTELAGYVSTKLMFGEKKNESNEFGMARLIIVPGIHLHYYASLANFSLEPRLSVKYNLTSELRIKVATGLYSQNLISSSSDRDVVDLFYGFISGPENLQSEFNGEELKHKLQKSTHLIGGLEYDLFKHITLNFEAYYKWYNQLTNMNKNKVFEDTPEYADKPDYLKKDFIIESGNAYGFDFSGKYTFKNLYVWAVYSLSYNHRFDGIVTYIPHFDRRHNVNLVVDYAMGKLQLWNASLRWNFGSGFPFTPTAGNYEMLDFSDGINSDYTTANGQIGILYGDINSKRLPSYHRLDVSVKRKFLLSDKSTLEATLSITNLYNRSNIFYIDRIQNKRIDQLPFMPSLGLSLTF